MKITLEEFGELSGMCPNPQKRSLFIAGTDASVAADISSLMQMEVKHLPVKYLGVPLISSRLRRWIVKSLRLKSSRKYIIGTQKLYLMLVEYNLLLLC